MAIISTVIERFRTVAASTLTSYQELSDAYDLPNNIDNRLLAGWGVKITGGSPSGLDELCQQVITQYQVSLILTQDTTRIQSSDTGLISAIKTLYDDEVLFRQAIYLPNLLVGNSSAQITFDEIQGPEFIDQGNPYRDSGYDYPKFVTISSNYIIRTQD